MSKPLVKMKRSDEELLISADSLLSLCRHRERLTQLTKDDIDVLLNELRPRTDEIIRSQRERENRKQG